MSFESIRRKNHRLLCSLCDYRDGNQIEDEYISTFLMMKNLLTPNGSSAETFSCPCPCPWLWLWDLLAPLAPSTLLSLELCALRRHGPRSGRASRGRIRALLAPHILMVCQVWFLDYLRSSCSSTLLSWHSTAKSYDKLRAQNSCQNSLALRNLGALVVRGKPSVGR